jgi:hypothetical protein
MVSVLQGKHLERELDGIHAVPCGPTLRAGSSARLQAPIASASTRTAAKRPLVLREQELASAPPGLPLRLTLSTSKARA